ncbi:MAG TPA: MFS transporter [Thermoleophilaceae bacterium]
MEAARNAGRVRALTGFAALGIFWGAWGAELPAVKAHAGAGDAALGVALFCIGAGALVAMRPAGVLLDRRGREVLPAITALFAVAGFLPALATTPFELAAALLLLGAASGSLDVAINAEAVRAEAVGAPVLRLAHGMFSVAAVTGALAAGGLRAAGASPAGVFAVVCGLVLGGGVATLVLEAAPPRREDAARLRDLLRAPWPLVALGGLCALAFFVEGSWQTWGAVHLQNTLGASAALSAAAPAVFAASAAVGRIAGQGLKAPERVALTAAATLAAAGTAVAATAASPAIALVGIAVAGLGTSICAPTLIAIAGRRALPERRGSAVSVVTTVAYLGFLLGPAAVGVAADATTLRTALAAVAGLALLLALLARRAPGAT